MEFMINLVRTAPKMLVVSFSTCIGGENDPGDANVASLGKER